MGATNLQRRLEGAKDALKAAPGIEVVEAYDIKEDAVRCAEIIATGSRRYPDLGAWLSVGGWPVFTRNALAGVDPSRTRSSRSIPWRARSICCVRVKCRSCSARRYFGWGSEPVKLLHGIKNGRNPASAIIDSGVDVVTRENMDAYVAEFKRLEAGK